MPSSTPSHPATARLGLLLRRVVRRHDAELGAGPLVLAVSGGADSLAMLLAAATVRHALKHDLVVAHVSHGIRRTAERGEAHTVRRTADQLGVPFAHHQAHLSGDEASARDARYAFLAQVASEHGAAAVLTAHTQDDQAETLQLRLTRGAGLRGAGALRELSVRAIDGQGLTLLRPMLEATREDTLAVCAEWTVSPASDGTNRSLRYARNRIRRRVLPELEAINPDARAALAAFAADAQADEDLLQTTASNAIEGAQAFGEGRVEWRTKVLAGLPKPLLVRVLQSAWALLLGEGHALARRQLGSMARGLQRGTGSVDLGEGLTFTVEQDRTRLQPSVAKAESPRPATLPIPGAARFGEWSVAVAVALARRSAEGPWEAVLDADALGTNVCVRVRKRGDRFQPLGMAREIRLQDVLVNAKVPRSERDRLPLVVGAKGIAWVPGVRIAEWAKVTERTARIVAIRVSRAAPES